MLSLLSFGKRRRRSTKRRSVRKSRKSGSGRKPPSRLLKLAKRLGIKVTVKRGSKRVYKSKTALKKLVVKKLRLIKKKKLAMKKKSKRVYKRKGSRRVRKGSRRVRRY